MLQQIQPCRGLRLRATSAGCVVRFAMSQLAISASAVRELLAQGKSARYLLPEVVLDYIDSNRLYSREPDGR